MRSEYRKFRRRFFCLFIIYSLSGLVSAEEKPKLVTFNIPRQRADLSLIKFAEQADITLLFPLNKIKGKEANRLIGQYSIINALKILLKNTGLKTEVSESGQLSILIDPSFERNDNMANYKKNKVASAVLAVLSAAIVSPAVLAEADNANKETEVIEVRGIKGALGRAMDTKREARGVVDSISAEDIGKFPDTNLAESLQRITGVSIDRSGGEGQQITVRGFGPQFNTILVNGRQLASEDPSRAFSFDTLAAEMVKTLDVHKTSTATIQSGGIGSTVNIDTAKPFAIGGFKLAGSVKGIYDGNSEKTTPQGSVLISNTFNDDTFGALLAISYQERESKLDRARINGWNENAGLGFGNDLASGGTNPGVQARTADGSLYTGNTFIPQIYDTMVSLEKRERTNANLVLQYAPNDSLIVTADALYSDFDITSDTRSYGHWFTSQNLEYLTVDENGTATDFYQEQGLATDLHAKRFDRLTESKSFGLNFDWDVNDNLNMQFDISNSNAKRAANNGLNDSIALLGYANRAQFINDGLDLPYFNNDFTSANAGIYSGQQEFDGVSKTNPTDAATGVSGFLDPANLRAHVLIRRAQQIEDDVVQLRWNGEWIGNGDNGFSAARFGAMYSSETKTVNEWNNTADNTHCIFCNYLDNPNLSSIDFSTFDAGGGFLGDASGSGRMPTSWLTFDGDQVFDFADSIHPTGGTFDAKKTSNSFEVEEETASLYLELDFEGEVAGMPLYSTAGFRYETTDVTVDATQQNLTNLTFLDQTEMAQHFGPLQDFSEKNSYDEILPNFSAKLEITDALVARVAVSKTLTRPTLTNLRPITSIDTTRQGILRSSGGNSQLVPFSSDNLDLSLEWYYDDASYLSAGYFRKHVANFIVNTTENKTFEDASGNVITDPSSGSDPQAIDSDDGAAVFTHTIPSNGEAAVVDGWELAAQHTFESGFGLIGNATFVDSDAQLDNADITQVFALTGLSDSANFIAFYENGPFQGRLAYNWRGEFLQSLSQTNGDGVTIVESYFQWDASASYDISENVTVFVEGINLTEEYTRSHGRFSNQLLDLVDSGRRISFGVRGSF